MHSYQAYLILWHGEWSESMNGMNTINSIFVFKDLEQEPLNEGPEITFYQVSSLELDQYQLK